LCDEDELDTNVPGFSVAISRKGPIPLRAGFGMAARILSLKVTTDNAFRIASVTNPSRQ